MPTNNIMQLQQMLSQANDQQLQQVLSMPSAQIPQILVMMEMADREHMRNQVRQRPPEQTMMAEMAQGRYKPFPPAPVGLGTLPQAQQVQMPPSMGTGQYTPQQPTNP